MPKIIPIQKLESKIKGNARVPTGIPGFDRISSGGFVDGSVNLISGSAGTGKTIFASQFLYNGAVEYDEKGLFVSFEEDLDNLKLDMKEFGWDFEELEKADKVRFVYLGPYETTDLQARLIREISKTNATRVVIDTISVFAMALKNDYEIRKEIYTLASMLKRLNCTVLLTSEVVGDLAESGNYNALSRYGVEEFVADSVITLHYSGLGGKGDRAIRILKMRRTNHKKGVVSMEITDKGILVYP